MRIIAGKYKGRVLNPPSGLPVRPTKDWAKEGLFNILEHRYGIEGKKILDGFAGTGNITFEFLSRGAEEVLAVDENLKCLAYIEKMIHELGDLNGKKVRSDVMKFLKTTNEKFDIIFFDPPYAMLNQEELIKICFERELLNEDGLIILEHRSGKDLSSLPGFGESRKYGDSTFSFFLNENEQNTVKS